MPKTHAEVVEAARIQKMKWRHANPEKAKAQGAAWEAANKDKVRAKTKRQYSKHREKMLEKARLKRLANPEKMRAQRRAYYTANVEKIREQKLLWRLANLEKVRESERKDRGDRRVARAFYERRRNARKKGAGGAHTKDQFVALCDAYAWCCAYCGVSCERLHAEHIVALSNGGDNGIGNLAPSCLSCNSTKRSRSVEEFIVAEVKKGKGINPTPEAFWIRHREIISRFMPWLLEDER